MKGTTLPRTARTAPRAAPGRNTETFGHEPVAAYYAAPGIRSAGPWCARCMIRERRWSLDGHCNVVRRSHAVRPVPWPCTSALVLGLAVVDAGRWNRRYPVGTPVFAYPDVRPEHPAYNAATRLNTVTRTPAWRLGHGESVVSVEGYAGGIALSHVDVP